MDQQAKIIGTMSLEMVAPLMILETKWNAALNKYT